MKCDICSKTFNNYRQLNGHKRIHGETKGKYPFRPVKAKTQFNCIGCGNDFELGKNTKGKYCSNQCQSDHYKNQKLLEVELGENKKPKWIKKYLLEKYGNKCMDPLCAWDQNIRPINTELEHIDGNSENNSLENCILLCPCCHSLTPTYKSKNMGNGRVKRREREATKKHLFWVEPDGSRRSIKRMKERNEPKVGFEPTRE